MAKRPAPPPTIKPIEEKSHALFSPSGSDRWLACPGSINLSKDLPPQPSSPYAEEGTKAHHVLELLLGEYIAGRGPSSLAFSLKKKYPKEMIEHALAFIEDVDARAGKLSEPTVLSETKAELHFIDPDMGGTADCAIVEEFGRLVVIDYKYGAGVPVDPEENTQLICYALGIAHRYDYNFDEVEIVVNQPRAEHDRGPVRSWLIPMETLLGWKLVLSEGAKKARDPLAELASGDHCRWCPAKIKCPEVSTQAFKKAAIVFDQADAKSLALPDAAAVPIEKMASVLDASKKIRGWIEAVEEHAFDLLKRGVKIPGWKLVDKRSPRRWADPEDAENAAVRAFGTGALKDVLLSPAQLEKEFGPERTKKFIEKFSTNESSGMTLAPESDKRPSVSVIETVFGDLPEEKGAAPTKTKATAKKKK